MSSIVGASVSGGLTEQEEFVSVSVRNESDNDASKMTRAMIFQRPDSVTILTFVKRFQPGTRLVAPTVIFHGDQWIISPEMWG